MYKVLYFIAWTILIIDSLFLILLILAQESKAQGLGGLGGGMDMSFAGHTQRTAKRLTAIGSAIFVVCIIAVILLMIPAGKSSKSTLPNPVTLQPSPSVEVTLPAGMPNGMPNGMPAQPGITVIPPGAN